MAETQETIADIIAEMRIFKCRNLETGELESCNAIANYLADRLEAAHRREVATTKESLAVGNSGDCAKLREVISTLRTALKEIRNDVLDMVMNHKSEDPDSYAHGLCLSIGGACDMALNSTKEFDDADE